MPNTLRWSEMSEQDRDALVHLKVMMNVCAGKAGKHQRVYVDGSPATIWWYCSECAKRWREDPGEHSADIPPHYTTDMNAAWRVVRRLNHPNSPAFPDYQDYANFVSELTKIVGSDMFFDLFYCDHGGDHLTPDRICIASLRAVGVTIEE